MFEHPFAPVSLSRGKFKMCLLFHFSLVQKFRCFKLNCLTSLLKSLKLATCYIFDVITFVDVRTEEVPIIEY